MCLEKVSSISPVVAFVYLISLSRVSIRIPPRSITYRLYPGFSDSVSDKLPTSEAREPDSQAPIQ